MLQLECIRRLLPTVQLLQSGPFEKKRNKSKFTCLVFSIEADRQVILLIEAQDYNNIDNADIITPYTEIIL